MTREEFIKKLTEKYVDAEPNPHNTDDPLDLWGTAPLKSRQLMLMWIEQSADLYVGRINKIVANRHDNPYFVTSLQDLNTEIRRELTKVREMGER